MFQKMLNFALNKPKTVFAIAGLVTLIALLQFLRVKTDTDPENMLPENEFVRVFNKEVKKEFAIYDYVVLGVVNEADKDGVFNPATLEKVKNITEAVKGIEGVIAYELMSLANKDDIDTAGPGALSFQWLMGEPPYTQEQAAHIKARAMDNPLFYNTLISQDAKALCLYVPIKSKKDSYRVAKAIGAIVNKYSGNEKYYMAGLPLAQDAFGVEMFWQMGISAPLAVLVIFFLMWWFFKNLRLVMMPIVMAMLVVIWTMGLMIGMGFPIHIMSSMIPIFLLPISILDSIHILSEFFEKYSTFKDKRKTISYVLNDLYRPNLFTSLTTIAGFVSLSFAPIPPVQVFGIFVGIGVALAWVATVVMVPAYVVLMKDAKIAGSFAQGEAPHAGLLADLLGFTGRFVTRHYRLLLWGVLAVMIVAVYGITRININDNPVRWFGTKHPIRIADKVLNAHFGGTYSAYLVLDAKDKNAEVFKEPEMLRYIERLQSYLYEKGAVGKSTTIADISKKVYYELLGGDKANNVVPPSKNAVAQVLLSFENSHKPDDLWHFVTPDYSKANIWLQLVSGDNKDMAKVVKQVDTFFKDNPPPFDIKREWAGLTYINMVWQDKMVGGMFVNFLGSFFIVLFMMVVLFRSPIVGLISMIPLTFTVIFIYGFLGLVGKDYDMPVAVLSALTLGLAIDYAIHFIERARALYREHADWNKVSEEMFQSPARALLKNALVVSIGFLPLFASPLVPYNTVGLFMFLIMIVASGATLKILPAIITANPKLVFNEKEHMVCSCRNCMVMAIIVSLTIVYILLGYNLAGLNLTAKIAITVVIVMAAICSVVSKHKICKTNQEGKDA